jgi:hypothetical protein
MDTQTISKTLFDSIDDSAPDDFRELIKCGIDATLAYERGHVLLDEYQVSMSTLSQRLGKIAHPAVTHVQHLITDIILAPSI